MAKRCPHCNDTHGPKEYATGYFVEGKHPNAKIVEVHGEGDALAYGRDNKLVIYWTRDAAEDAIARLDPATVTHERTGSVVDEA